ncbi:T9SS type A sorting domain-containing protein [Parasediminibacterium sp. JCM 36343]|uniref:T9SS type A sorting domain-containing protein n=1 Tax=Parasediminibacterium sp. JCM 36343 TaxID=3374279 RepID=UPI00397B1F45
MKRNFTSLLCLLAIAPLTGFSQNIFSGERVQIVGSFQGYTTTPYGTDYRTTTYRRVSIDTSNPTDGRGQWATTINVQTTNGDVLPMNMPGGGGAGFLFITGPTSSPYQNKWAFNGVGQAALNGINTVVYNGTTDMGLNMGSAGYYTFVFNDAGYSNTNAKFFVGVTDTVPVTPKRASESLVFLLNGNNDSVVVINVVVNTKPSANENIFVRYTKNISGDFSGKDSTFITRAIPSSDTTFSATVPPHVKYYVFTSTVSLATLSTTTESNKSLAAIRYDDNAGKDYITLSGLPVALSAFDGQLSNNTIALSWKTATEVNTASFEIEKLDGTWKKLGIVAAANKPNGSTYTFIDKNLLAVNTYRLKSIDKDGLFVYSKVVVVNAPNNKESIRVYPTVIKGRQVNIALNRLTAGKANISLVALDGRVMQRSTLSISAGSTLLPYTMPSLPRGNYIIKVETEANKQSFKVVVQ